MPSEWQKATAVVFLMTKYFSKMGHTNSFHHSHFEVVVHKFLSFILFAAFQISPADPSYLNIIAIAVFKEPNVNRICRRNGSFLEWVLLCAVLPDITCQ